MNYIVIYKNNILLDTFKNEYNYELWGGFFSTMTANGNMFKFIKTYLENQEAIIITCRSDGYLHLNEIDMIVNKLKDKYKNTKIIVATVIFPNLNINDIPKNIKYLCLPQDDNFFMNGVNHYFNNVPMWKERSNTIFWRGSVSGGQIGSLRYRMVEKLIDYLDSDVKLIRGWEVPNLIPDHFFGDKVDYTQFLNYKIILIVDGNGISSSHMWSFASGCVPILITNNVCWFNKYLTPFVNYIPVKHDLSDLIEQIEWVKNNDNEAKQIAENAVKFSKEIFSSEFQKKYIMKEIDIFLQN